MNNDDNPTAQVEIFLELFTLCVLYGIITVQGEKRYANETKGNGEADPC